MTFRKRDVFKRFEKYSAATEQEDCGLPASQRFFSLACSERADDGCLGVFTQLVKRNVRSKSDRFTSQRSDVVSWTIDKDVS